MIKFFSWIISCALSEVLFHFGYTFGQIYLDKLGNSQKVALNGDTSSSESSDTIQTDRGAYFSSSSSIKLYPNELYTSYDPVQTDFIMIIWSFTITNQDGVIYSRYLNSQNFINLIRHSSSQCIRLQVSISGVVITEDSSSSSLHTCIIHLAKWQMISLSISMSTLKVYLNTDIVITHILTSAYSEIDPFQPYLGKSPSGNANIAILWYYYHNYTQTPISNFISSSNGDCLTPTCDSCNFNIYDPIKKTSGCLPDSENIFAYGKSEVACPSTCTNQNLGCFETSCLSCSCGLNICSLDSAGSISCQCPTGTVLNGATCQCSEAGKSLVGVKCLNCDSSCLTCNSLEQCTACVASNATVINGKCECNSGYYNTSALTTSSSCISCNVECKTCNFSSQTVTCLTCKSSNASPNLSGGCSCLSGFYSTTSLTEVDSCNACHSHCVNCTSANTCLSCKALSAVAGEIGCFCNQGSYLSGSLDSTSGECKSCPSGCSSCSNETFCTSCSDVLKTAQNGVCVCQSGFYSNGGSCASCHSHCLTCNSPDACLSCKATSAVQSQVGCLCSLGKYLLGSLDSVSGECKSCLSDCSSCSDGVSCLTCSDSLKFVQNGMCLCKAGYFNSSGICYACHSHCSDCAGPDKCSSCKVASADIAGVGCFCKSGTYLVGSFDSVDGMCQSCTSGCASCTDGNTCSLCYDTSMIIQNGVCVCQSGYFYNGSTCSSCNSHCSSCTSADICSSCKVTSSIKANIGCSCPQGTYLVGSLDLITGECSSCLAECSSCSDGISCTACSDPLKLVKDGKCVCQTGYYLDAGTCFSCHQDCNTCNNSLMCIDCKSSNAVINSVSGCDCNAGYWKNNSDCVACSSECTECTSSSYCTKCLAISADPINGVCQCKSGYKTDPILPIHINSCFLCLSECSDCSNNSSCTSCITTNSELDQSSRCKCKSGFFQSGSLSLADSCKSCSFECLSCDGLSGNCQSCTYPNSTPNLFKTCSCDSKYYKAYGINSASCMPCSSNCLSCTSSNDCASCEIGFALTGLGVCSSCPALCLSCDSNLNCLSCDSNSELVKSKCQCISGFYLNQVTEICDPCLSICETCNQTDSCTSCIDSHTFPPLCEECHSSCLTCSGATSYECNTCNDLLLLNNCVDICPLGLVPSSGVCLKKGSEDLSLSFLFRDVGESFFDSCSNISAYKKTFEVQKSEATDPVIVYDRGVYFSGGSSLEINETGFKLFNIEYSLSFWIRPETISSVLLARTENVTQELLTVKLIQNLLEINLKNTSLSTSAIIEQDTWQHIWISEQFKLGRQVNVWKNKEFIQQFSVLTEPFIDSSDGLFFLGSGFNFSNAYQGFLFNFQLFRSALNPLSVIFDKDCSGCKPCLGTVDEISTCQKDQCLSDFSMSCESCLSSCETCRNNQTCNLCKDLNCLYCFDYDSDSCYECFPQFEAINGKCVPCETSCFFESASKTCQPCPVPCTKCLNSTYCLDCDGKSELMPNHSCFCSKGYYLDIVCKQKIFYANLTVSQDFEVVLWFDEPLQTKLKSNQIQLYLDEKKIDFEVKRLEMDRFKIVVDKVTLKEGANLTVVFTENIWSEDKALLGTQRLQKDIKITKNQEKNNRLNKKAEEFKELGTNGAVSGASIALGVSIINYDASSFVDFLNTAELLYCVYFFDIPLHPNLKGFLLGIRIHKNAPKLFKYFYETSLGTSLNSDHKSFGYKSNLFLLNTEPYLQSLAFSIFIYILLHFLMKVEKIKNKIAPLFSLFRFTVFLRFWMQSFLEFLTCVRIGIIFNQLENYIQIIDFTICVLIIVIQVILLFILLMLIYKRGRAISEDEKQSFYKRFGVFFIEFKEDHFSFWLFYLIYFLRRILIVIVCVASTSGFFQMITCVIMVLLVFDIQVISYVLVMKCFKDGFLNIYHFVKEVVILVYYSIICYCCITVDGMTERSADACIYLIFFAWILNILFSVVVTVKKVKAILDERKKTKIFAFHINDINITSERDQKNKKNVNQLKMNNIQ